MWCQMSKPENTYNKIVRELEAAGANLRCKDLVRALRSLGFDVRDGRKQGHKVITHPGIADFSADGFTCGHGTNPEIKPVYVKKMVKLMRSYEPDLTEFLREST